MRLSHCTRRRIKILKRIDCTLYKFRLQTMVPATIIAAVWFEAFPPVCFSPIGEVTFWIRFQSDQSPGPSRYRLLRAVLQAFQGAAPLVFEFIDGTCRARGATVNATELHNLPRRLSGLHRSVKRTCSIQAQTLHSPSMINSFYSFFTPLPQIFGKN